MADVTGRTSRAAALHRRAAATAAAAAGILDEIRPVPADQRRQYELADRLRRSAARLAPDWAGGCLDALTPDVPAGDAAPPFVRVGEAAPLDDARFPALVPLIGTGHLTVDVDARDPRVVGLLRALVLRLLAASPAGCLLIRGVDGGRTGTFTPFTALADTGLLPPPAVDPAGLRAVLGEAEQWLAAGGARRRRDRTMLLVIAALPEQVGAADLTRIEALAERGPHAGLCLVVAGWPPATVDQQVTAVGDGRRSGARLPHGTPLAVRTAYALLGNPPGASFTGPGAEQPDGLNSPVFLDGDPSPELINTVCQRLARRVAAGTPLTLATLLPPVDAPLWPANSAEGLSTVVGDADGRPVTLGLTDLTPHWLVSGRPGGGRSDFLTNVLLGLAARYAPDELVVHLVDLADGESFTEFLQTRRDPSWIPQVRTAALAADPEYVQDLFDRLEAELRRREAAGQRAGGQRFAGLRSHQPMPRIVCVIDNVPLLLGLPGTGQRQTSRDRLATDLATRLDALARAGRAYGIHLILAGDGELGIGTGTATRDSVLGQFPVRVALPGGGSVLEPTNDAAAGLAVGSAVVNTAGGLGGPRGATRGHERVVRFPDPHDEPDALAELRRRLWSARPPDSAPPVVFAGYARPSLRNDPLFRAAVAGSAPVPAALLGRAVDVARTTLAVPFTPSPGRNLAVLGSGPEAMALLATAARSLAAHLRPGTARFVIAALTTSAADCAAALAAELGDQQTVEVVDLPGLLGVTADDRPGYWVVFGADGPGGVPDEPLRALLRHGPPGGRHVLGWWRSVSSFSSLLGPDEDVGQVASVVVVDIAGSHLTPVVGRAVAWSPRPGRALLWDGARMRARVFVPFGTDDREAT